jgi:acyl-CoA synthetase (AMP-forming)/AMP-acid ligase II
VVEAAHAFAGRLAQAGVAPGDRLVIWSENRIEWIVALWGTLLTRAVLVHVDYPNHNELKAGTLSSIIRQSGLARTLFESWPTS